MCSGQDGRLLGMFSKVDLLSYRQQGELHQETLDEPFFFTKACTQGQGHGITFASDSPGFINVRWDSGEAPRK